MRNNGVERTAASDLLTVLAGAAFTFALTGAVLALLDADSALRAPTVLFFLFTGPAAGLYAVLPGLEPAARAAVSASGALVTVLLTGWLRASWDAFPTGAGIVSVAALTALLFARAGARAWRSNNRTFEQQTTDEVSNM
ncbi:hypothetical protein [Streptomyces sp. NPDC001985]|uniref:hypothetical protein n=1 Tax=Streptomyces sp. NPDC001985 TaxID=3154406 RepID=UPI00332DA039